MHTKKSKHETLNIIVGRTRIKPKPGLVKFYDVNVVSLTPDIISQRHFKTPRHEAYLIKQQQEHLTYTLFGFII